MSKENGKELMSFTENGQRWLQCKVCYDYKKVDEDTAGITCSTCVMKIDVMKYPETALPKQKKSTGRPPGWHFMNEFVDKDGNVFHKGKEQPDLKGTLEPTKVKPRKKKKKLTPDEKLQRDIKRWNKRKKARRGKK